MEIYQYEGQQKEWDSFAGNHPEGRFFQLIGYKQAIEETYGYEGLYYLFKKDGETVAILPSFKLNSLLLGRRLLSSPFAEYGGFLGNDLSLEDLKAVAALLQQILLEHKLPFLEIHGGLGLSAELMRSVFHPVPMYEYAILPLKKAQDVWDSCLDYQVRKAVRKARKANLVAYEETEAMAEAISQKFYPLYLISMKRLGTPPHPEKLFLNYWRYLKDNMKLFLVNESASSNLTIAALLGFAVGKRIHIIHTVSDPEHWDKRPNDLAHWAFIEWACNKGYEIFDFAVVRYEGQRRYKEKWGVQLNNYSHYYLFSENRKKAKAPVVTPIDPSSLRGIRLFSWIWRNCVPLGLTEPMGLPIRRRLGR